MNIAECPKAGRATGMQEPIGIHSNADDIAQEVQSRGLAHGDIHSTGTTNVCSSTRALTERRPLLLTYYI